MNKKPNQNSLRTVAEVSHARTLEAEKALETSNRFFSTLAKISPVGIFRTDAQGNCVYVSERWCEIAGMAQDDALGEGWAQAIHLDDREQVVQAWNTSTQIRQNFSREYRFQQPNGITRWVLGQAAAEWGATGELIGYVGTITDITQSKQTEEELQKFFNLAPDLLCISSFDGDFLKINSSWQRTLGYSEQEILSTPLLELIHPDDKDSTIKRMAQGMTVGATIQFNSRYRCKDGSYKWLEWTAAPDVDKRLIFASARDVTARKQAKEALQESEARYRYLFQANPHPMWIYDLETLRFLAVNNAAVAHYGYSLGEFLTMTIKDIRPSGDIQPLLEKLSHLDKTNINISGIWRHLKKNGTLIDVEITSHRLNFGGSDARLVLINDITERKHAEERIQHLAHFDSLTGLPNRSLLGDRVSQAIRMAQRNHDKLAMLFVDLDHFKNINDTLGHRIGDGLLTEIAKRLKSVVREEDTVARLGGDEFVLLLPRTDADGAAHVAEKLLEAVAQRYQIEQYELVITTSIGIAIYPNDGMDFDSLTRCADVAMYRGKRDGRNNFRFFTAEMQASSVRKLQLENALRRALERDQLRLHYQPQASIEDGCLIGAEALLRWQHPELGMVSPAEFIPIAEDSGLILSIGEWVLRTAVRQLKTWMDTGIAPMIIAVNLSAVQFRQPQLLKLVTQILKEEGLPPQYLELELTEGVTVNDPPTAVTVMNNLHEHGIRMSIDDFGTGYSSLSYLKRFHVYKLKIDQSFVRDIAEDLEDKTIVKAIINLAKGLGLRTIAEGVETKEQLEFLRENGCDEIQGYYYSKPLPADQFEAFVRGKS